MHLSTSRLILTLLLFAGIDASAAGARVVDQGPALDARVSGARIEAARVYRLAASGKQAQVLEAVERVQEVYADDAVVQDYIVYETLLALSSVTPDARSRRFVESYDGEDIATWVRLQDEHGKAVVPLYDLGAAARLTLHNWDVRDAEALVATMLAEGSWSPQALTADSMRPASMGDDAWLAGTLEAFKKADALSLGVYRQALLYAHASDARFDILVFEMARRLKDVECYESVIDIAEHRVAIQSVTALVDDLVPADALRLLERAAGNAQLASAAILETGRLLPVAPRSRALLLSWLADPVNGGSAALALARDSSTTTLDALQSHLLEGHEGLATLRAALALNLSSSQGAADVRHSLAKHPSVAASVKKVLR